MKPSAKQRAYKARRAAVRSLQAAARYQVSASKRQLLQLASLGLVEPEL